MSEQVINKIFNELEVMRQMSFTVTRHEAMVAMCEIMESAGYDCCTGVKR